MITQKSRFAPPLLTLAMTLALAGPAFGAGYEPVNCDNPEGPAQKAICKSHKLGQADARMATLYDIATSLVGMGQRGVMQDAQQAWIKDRDACGDDETCLIRAYWRRIQELNEAVSAIASRGPF